MRLLVGLSVGRKDEVDWVKWCLMMEICGTGQDKRSVN